MAPRTARVGCCLAGLALIGASLAQPAFAAVGRTVHDAAATPAVVGTPAPTQVVLGQSVTGQTITATHRTGAGPITRTLVVIGQIHGNEPGGMRVVDALGTLALPAGLDLWLVPTLNPDGLAAGTRGNSRGVDLNRNFPLSWARTPTSGARGSSEPETRAATSFLTKLRPDAVVSFHQALYGVDTSIPRTRRFYKLLAAQTGLPLKAFFCTSGCHGTMTQWFNAKLRGYAVTVELNAAPSQALIDRSAAGVLAATMALPK